MNQHIFSIPQAAKLCALSRGTLWKYAKSGELKTSLTPGGQYRILKKDLESFMRAKGMYPLANYQPAGKKILIVDDDPQIQRLLTTMLSAQKYETTVASSGFEAGALVIKLKPDLVILDLFMPGMDGFEVCQQLKEDPEISHVKILAVTGFDTPENRDRIIAAGADGYLAKPLKKKAVFQQVESLLNN